jgi:hypothetical protein
LFDYVVDLGYNMAFVGAFFVGICDDFGDAERGCMKRSLRDESIWCWNTEETRDAGCQTKEKEVPVKAGGFTEWEFGSLGDKRGYFMMLALLHSTYDYDLPL